jgi:quercetin dioxygenase-like cupin family protein
MYSRDARMSAAPIPNDQNARQLAAFALATVVLLTFAVGFHTSDRHPALPERALATTADAMPAIAAARPRPVAQPVSSDALPHVQGKRITTMVVEFPPNGFSPPHHHAGSVTVYVLSGVIRSQLQGQPPLMYRTGESFFEPPGAVHLLAENMSTTEPARILAVFVADEGATLTTYH